MNILTSTVLGTSREILIHLQKTIFKYNQVLDQNHTKYIGEIENIKLIKSNFSSLKEEYSKFQSTRKLVLNNFETS